MPSGSESSLWVACLVVVVPSVVGWCVWVLAQKRSIAVKLQEMQTHRDTLQDELTQARTQTETYRKEIDQLRGDIHEAEKQLAVATQTQRNIQQQFDKAQAQLRDAFKSLAGDALKQSTEQFLELAKKSFESGQKDATAQLEQRKAAIEAMIKPIRESLGRYDTSMKAVEEARRQAYGQLTKQVELMTADQRRLRQETGNLVRALRKPNVRGRWGQVQLRRVVELAGMIPHCDFEEEHTVRDGDQALRPDLVVNLPNGRTIVIDAKTPLDAYLEALECQEETDQHQHLLRHANQLATKVKDLSAKQYHAQFERSPQFVVLFIPGESFLYAALEHRPELSEAAMAQGVVIATPSTLMSLLKTVALGWQEESIAENAKRISELGRELHHRLATAVGHVEKLGQQLKRAVDAYNQFKGSLEGRVLPQARKFEKMGIQVRKELPGSLADIETLPQPANKLSHDQPSESSPAIG